MKHQWYETRTVETTRVFECLRCKIQKLEHVNLLGDGKDSVRYHKNSDDYLGTEIEPKCK